MHPDWSTSIFFFFFFNDTATTEIYTLSLHDALPIYGAAPVPAAPAPVSTATLVMACQATDRKSTRLNSSHGYISYAVFCLKKKKPTAIILPSCATPVQSTLSACFRLSSQHPFLIHHD